MKYKIGIILLSGIIITSLIYFNVDKSKINVLALGDGLSLGMTAYHVEGYDFNDYLVADLNEKNKLDTYYRFFNETDETVTNLLNKINNNIFSIDKKTKIKQAIKSADIITIAIGMDELNNYALKNNLGSTKINGYLQKMQELLSQIKKLNNKKTYVLSLYPTHLIISNKIEKINLELEKICQENQINFINISDITKNEDYFALKTNYYPNYKGHQFIYQKIIEKLKSL